MLRKNSTIDCPRCLGKGFVNESDILRLDRFVEWSPGLCGYCGGSGKINSDEYRDIAENNIYLSSDITREDRRKYINQDKGAIERAEQHRYINDITIIVIKHLYFNENRTIEEILDIFELPTEIGDSKRENFEAYISRIITHTTKIG